MGDRPKVSVIIPTYKRPDTLVRAIESVRRQMYRPIEIIVVDDNHPDDEFRRKTERVMARYGGEPSITYIRHATNRNGAAARNTGIDNAGGDYIAFLDDDDEFLPDKIENQIARMEALDGSWGACYTNYVKVKDGKVIQRGAEKREGSLKKEVLMKNLYIYAGSNLLVRKAALDKIYGFDERFRRNQDLEFLVRLLDHYKIAYVDSRSLIMHYDSRVTILNADDLTRINGLFLDSFRTHIQALPQREQHELYLLMELDRFRFLLQHEGAKRAFAHVLDKKIGLGVLLRYVFYLAHRKMTGKCYGFSIR